LDEKYKTTSFFGVKLLKCLFGKKKNLKNARKNDVILKEKEKKKKEEEDARTQAKDKSPVKLLACADRGCRLGVFGGCRPSRLSQGEAGGRRPSGFSQGEMEPPPRWVGCLFFF
jgi:hypothetical protein